MSDYLRILELRKWVQFYLNEVNKTCSKNDANKVVKIFEKHTNNGPFMASYCDETKNKSYGFYIALLRLARYETKPKPFFDVLEIDYKIGWVNPIHVESRVFYWKAIKIIEDEKVFESKNFYGKRFYCTKIYVFDYFIL